MDYVVLILQISAYTVHNLFLQKDSQLLEILYNKFYFDKRGEIKENEEPTIFEPIMQFKNNKLMFRYLRDYVDSGHKIQNKPLTEEQINEKKQEIWVK